MENPFDKSHSNFSDNTNMFGKANLTDMSSTGTSDYEEAFGTSRGVDNIKKMIKKYESSRQ